MEFIKITLVHDQSYFCLEVEFLDKLFLTVLNFNAKDIIHRSGGSKNQQSFDANLDKNLAFNLAFFHGTYVLKTISYTLLGSSR